VVRPTEISGLAGSDANKSGNSTEGRQSSAAYSADAIASNGWQLHGLVVVHILVEVVLSFPINICLPEDESGLFECVSGVSPCKLYRLHLVGRPSGL
jgi:hypothetical protein